ncbi:toprim domain-containing protein [Candidatus Woesearchaeota archaeon]|nr:toprim domain-containing protein [Candidatus Woesearchaeota archaeon]
MDGVNGLQDKARIAGILERAADFFSKILWNSPEPLQYLKKRGFSDETIKEHNLGFIGNSWSALYDSFVNDYSYVLLEQAGLIVPRKDKLGYRDYFHHNRIMFPIKDSHGWFVGFAGRALDGSVPKYLNSREGLLFRKREVLYLLDTALSFDYDEVVVVEGYTDALMAHQFGLHNVVGVGGTALTEYQARFLSRYYDKAVVCFDPDAEGQKHARLAGLELHKAGLDARICVLPDKDLDEVLANEGSDSVVIRFACADWLYKCELERLMKNYDVALLSERERAKLLKGLLPFLSCSKDIVELSVYLSSTADWLGLSYNAVVDAFGSLKNNTVLPSNSLEEDLAVLAVRKPSCLQLLKAQVRPEDMSDSACRAVVTYVLRSPARILAEHSASPSFFDKDLIDPAEVLSYCKQTGLNVDDSSVYRLCAKIQACDASNLFPEDALLNFRRGHLLNHLDELVEGVLLRKSGALEEYCKVYDELISLSQE